MELFLLPTATALLALHGLVLLVSGFGHVIRQRMSQTPIETGDLVLAVILVLLSAPILAAYRIVSRREYGSLSSPSHLILLTSTLIESAIAVVFFWTIVSDPTNAVSDFVLGLVATSGLVTSAVLIISTELISKRA